MSIRLRRTLEGLVALCAARSVPLPGDMYLDDEAHMALARKFWIDYAGQELPTAEPWAVAATEREESNNTNRTEWDAWMSGEPDEAEHARRNAMVAHALAVGGVDCSGCTDPKSEGTHQMRTRQHGP